MDAIQYSKGIALLRGAFSQSKAELNDQRVLDVWFEALQDLDGEKFIANVFDIIRTKKFLPAISEIREAVLGTSDIDMDAKALLAWEKIQLGIRRAGYVKSIKFDDPVIHNTIRSLGGWIHLCSLPNENELKFFRIAFLKAYKGFYKAFSEGCLPEIDYLEGQTELENKLKFSDAVTPPVMIGNKNLPAIVSPGPFKGKQEETKC